MLTIDSGTVQNLVELAHEIAIQEQPQDVDSHNGSALDSEGDLYESHAHDPIVEQFRGAIDNLNEDQAFDLVVLMWIGRGTYTVEEFQEAKSVAKAEATHAVSDYLLNTPLLPDYLEEGLEMVRAKTQ